MQDRERVPGFELERVLGAGASGTVYLARETDGLNRTVALKVFDPRHSDAFTRELAFVRRSEDLRRRARAPGLVQALGTGTCADGTGWIALEYLEDGSLADVVAREGPLTTERALGYTLDAAQALALLHEDGLFHRDIKPANLLLGSDGRVRVATMHLPVAAAFRTARRMKRGTICPAAALPGVGGGDE